MSSSNCCFLTCIQVSQEAGQVDWYSHLFQNFPQFIVIHTVKVFGIVNKAEIDVFLELSCFFDDPHAQLRDEPRSSRIVLRHGFLKLPSLYAFPPGKSFLLFSSAQFSSVAQSFPMLCDPMNRSTPGLPVHHQLPEFTQTQVHQVSDAIQPSHPLSSPSLPAPNPSQHQSLF